MTDNISSLIPHRGDMQLISAVVSLSGSHAHAEVRISPASSFYQASSGGVPSWVGFEYMGQTAALIAGYQLQHGQVEPHLGFLLGLRKYEAKQSQFYNAEVLDVHCNELAVVGDKLATFQCGISRRADGMTLATAKLSVLRKALD